MEIQKVLVILGALTFSWLVVIMAIYGGITLYGRFYG